MKIDILDKNKNIIASKDLNYSSDFISASCVHQVVKSTLASRRQGNASTKGRSEVRGGGKKPFKQKGTGRARQGSSRSPLMVGGGVVFGPKPRSFEQKLNKKIARKALLSIVLDKVENNKILVFNTFPNFEKTRDADKFFQEKGITSVYVVGDGNTENSINFVRATSNLRYCKSSLMNGLSVYEAVSKEYLVLSEANLSSILNNGELNGK